MLLLMIFSIAMTPIYMLTDFKTSFHPIKQIGAQMSVLFRLLMHDISSAVKDKAEKKVKMPVYSRYEKAYSSKSHGQSYIEFDLNDFDFAEFFLLAYLFAYTSFVLWIIGSAIYSAIVYTAIYVNPEVEVVEQPKPKREITFHKYEDDINIDRYCPCTLSFNMTKEDKAKSTMTVIYNPNNGELKYSNLHSLTTTDYQKSTKEVLQGEYTYEVVNGRIKVTYDDYTFTVNANQGYVFINDLASIFYFNDDFELHRVSLQ